MSTYELIGNVEDTTISDNAVETISNNEPGTYENVSMTLVAMNKADKTIYKEIQSIGSTTVRIIKSAYSLTFTDATHPGVKASIYYAFNGSKLGAWFWDKELKYKIGENNTSIV